MNKPLTIDFAPKSFLAGLFNTAINNLNSAIDEVASKVSISGSNPILKLEALFNDSNSLLEYNRRMDLLEEFIPSVRLIRKVTYNSNVAESDSNREFFLFVEVIIRTH